MQAPAERISFLNFPDLSSFLFLPGRVKRYFHIGGRMGGSRKPNTAWHSAAIPPPLEATADYA